MHILFLTDNFPPEVNAPASRTFEHCREWAALGHRVTVITCAPNFPQGRVFAGYKNRLWQKELVAGITVIRVWSYITANEGFSRRIADYVSYMVSALVVSPFVRKVDIVVGTSPQFFTACAAYGVSRAKRIPFVFELRDLWPESIRAVGAMKDSLALAWIEKIELFLYREAALVVSVTNSFRKNLSKRGIDPAKVAVVTNGIDICRFKPRPKDQVLADALGLKGKFVAGYIGTHGMAHGLETLICAAEILQSRPDRDRYRILFLGDGASKARLIASAEAKNLHNVVFVDTVTKEEVARYWSLLDASIIHLKRNDLFKSVIPSKLFECMGMGIPVLHGVEGESADIVESEGMGVLFEPENAKELCEKLVGLANDENLRHNLSANGVRSAARYDRRALAGEMLAQLEAVVAGNAAPGASQA